MALGKLVGYTDISDIATPNGRFKLEDSSQNMIGNTMGRSLVVSVYPVLTVASSSLYKHQEQTLNGFFLNNMVEYFDVSKIVAANFWSFVVSE